MSVDVLNESDFSLDEMELVACAKYVMGEMKVHPQADLCVKLVDEPAMEVLHVQWMDLPGGTPSGLKVVREILDGVEDVHFAELNSHDVVRHDLVAAIVDAYGRWDNMPGSSSARRANEAKAVNTREHRRS